MVTEKITLEITSFKRLRKTDLNRLQLLLIELTASEKDTNLSTAMFCVYRERIKK